MVGYQTRPLDVKPNFCATPSNAELPRFCGSCKIRFARDCAYCPLCAAREELSAALSSAAPAWWERAPGVSALLLVGVGIGSAVTAALPGLLAAWRVLSWR